MKQFRKRSSLISSSEYPGGVVEDMFSSSFLVTVVAIVGSFVFVIIKTLAHARVRELEIRERIAMIERGLVPPPEVDPKGFDHAMSRLDRHEMCRAYSGNGAYGGRHRRAGVTFMESGSDSWSSSHSPARALPPHWGSAASSSSWARPSSSTASSTRGRSRPPCRVPPSRSRAAATSQEQPRHD